MKRLKKRYWFLLIISAIGLLYYGYHHWKYTPRPNPHPQYFMTVTGKVDPSLVGKIHLQWRGQYESTNPACQVTGNAWAEGAYTSRIARITRPIHINKDGAYHITFVLDIYKPGFCQWKPTYFTLYKVTNHSNDYLFAVGFTKTYLPNKRINPINITCAAKGICHNVQHPNLLNTLTLNDKHNYRITINIKEK